MSGVPNGGTEPVETLVERVRDALVNYGTWRMQKPRREKALAALTELAERLEAAERKFEKCQEDRALYARQAEAAERREAEVSADWTKMYNTKEDERARAEAAEARVAELERERNEWRNRTRNVTEWWKREKARVTALEEALRAYEDDALTEGEVRAKIRAALRVEGDEG